MTALLRSLLLGLVRLLVGAHARWDGCAPSSDRRIYFANHTSHLDTLVIAAALPGPYRGRVHPAAARDYWGKSALRRFIAERCLGAVLIDRRPHGRQDPLQPLEAVLAAGDSLILFPEGTRGDGEIGRFKSGLYHLARHFPDAEIVPVHLENLHRILPKGSPLLVPLICSLRIGAPVALQAGEGRDAFLQRARAALIALDRDAPTRRDAA